MTGKEEEEEDERKRGQGEEDWDTEKMKRWSSYRTSLFETYKKRKRL